MTKSLSDKLDQQTIDLNFPRYNSFEECCSLLSDLHKYLIKNGIKKLQDVEKDNLFISPNSSFLNSQIDSSLYSSFVNLALSFFYVQELYERNGIPVDKFSLEKQNDFVELMPDTDCLYMKNVFSETDLEGLSKSFTLPILEGIGDKMYQLNRINPRQITSPIEKFMKDQIHEIANYTQLGTRVAKIIKGFDLPFEANSLRDVSKELANEEQILHALKKDNFYNYFNNFLKLNAQFHHLTIHEGFAYDFIDLLGHEITETMRFAKMAHFNHHVLENLALSETNELAMPFHRKIYYPTRFSKKKSEEEFEKNKGYTIARLIEKTIRAETNSMNFSRSFLLNLENKLTALDVPIEIAKNMKTYLRYNSGAHKITTSASRMKKKDAFDILIEEERELDNYPQALSRLVKLTTGRNPAPISYQFFNKKNWIHSCGINTIVYATRPNKKYSDGIEILEESDSKFDPEHEIITTSKKFPDADILIKPNRGACFILESNPIGDIFNPSYSMIDVREAYEDIKNADEIAHKLCNLSLDVHEVVHASEIGTRLPWRSVIPSLAKAILNFSLVDLNRLNTEYTGRSLQRLMGKKSSKRTWQDVFLDIFDEYSLIALGQGKAAEIFRKYGAEIGSLKVGIGGMNKEEDYEIEKLRGLLRPTLEKSEATKLYIDCRDALVKKDKRLLEKMFIKASDMGAELSSICETTTEAYSYMACQDIIENGFGSALNREEKNYYSQSLYNKLLEPGIQAEKFFKILAETPKESQNELLTLSGMKYKKVIGPEDLDVVSNNLIKLGYNPMNSSEAYDDIKTLQSEAEMYDISFEDLLKPVNYSTALIGLRYSSKIPTIFDFRVKYGKKEGFKKLLEMESWKQIEKALKE